MGVALLATALTVAMPGLASAGVATSEAGAARFVDAAGAKDDLTVNLQFVDRSPSVDPQGWSVSFLQFAPPVTSGTGCEEGFVGTVCPFGQNAPGAIAVDLGAGDDELELGLKAEAAGAPTRISIAGGPGDDEISTVRARAEIDGGAGDDVIEPDERWALDVPPGPTPGGVIRGGAGIDTVDYEQTLDPISVSLDGVANDGRRREGDDVRADVENVTGSHYGNTLRGSAAGNVLVGGSGADRLAGGAGRDTLEGRGGNDTVDALDGTGGDRVACDDGADVAFVDAGDVIATQDTTGGAACEKVTWAPAIGASTLRYRDQRISVALSCPRSAQGCRGTLMLRSRARRPATLARAGYRIARGRRIALRLTPTRAGRAALARRFVSATAVVQPAGTQTDTGRAVSVRR